MEYIINVDIFTNEDMATKIGEVTVAYRNGNPSKSEMILAANTLVGKDKWHALFYGSPEIGEHMVHNPNYYGTKIKLKHAVRAIDRSVYVKAVVFEMDPQGTKVEDIVSEPIFFPGAAAWDAMTPSDRRTWISSLLKQDLINKIVCMDCLNLQPCHIKIVCKMTAQQLVDSGYVGTYEAWDEIGSMRFHRITKAVADAIEAAP